MDPFLIAYDERLYLFNETRVADDLGRIAAAELADTRVVDRHDPRLTLPPVEPRRLHNRKTTYPLRVGTEPEQSGGTTVLAAYAEASRSPGKRRTAGITNPDSGLDAGDQPQAAVMPARRARLPSAAMLP